MERFNNKIQDAVWTATPNLNVKWQNINSYPKETLELVKEKREATKLWQTTKYHVHKLEITYLLRS